MTLHSACGAEIRWADKDNTGKKFPPLEPTGRALIVGNDNIVREVTTYRIHVCDEEQAEQWVAMKAAERQQQTDYERSRQEFNEAAKKRPCPRCHVDTGEDCINLTVLRMKSETQPVRWCHEERYPKSSLDPELVD